MPQIERKKKGVGYMEVISFILLLVLGIAVYNFLVWFLPILWSFLVVVMLSLTSVGAAAGCLIGAYGAFKGIKNNLRRPAWENDDLCVRPYYMGTNWKHLMNVVNDTFSTIYGQAGCATAFLVVAIVVTWPIVIGLWGAAILIGSIFMVTLSLAAACTLPATIVTGVGIVLCRVFDSVELHRRKISVDCPECHGRFRRSLFVCPNCGVVHNLHPDGYGAFRHRCRCGCSLPTMFVNGRNSLKAVCPHCGSMMGDADTTQTVLQILGLPCEGKNRFFAMLIRELKDFYGGGTATTEPTAFRYRVDDGDCARTISLLDLDVVPTQVSLQQQFRYVDGFIFVIAPMQQASEIEDAVNSFLNIHRAVVGTKDRCMTPIAVVLMCGETDVVGDSKVFVEKMGLETAFAELEAYFSNVRYSSVRRMEDVQNVLINMGVK